MSDETYNGYPNRETYDVSLWLNNDQGFYNDVVQLAAEARESATEYDFEAEPTTYNADVALDTLRDTIESYWEEITDPDTYGDAEHYVTHILPMVKDVGSVFRVDWTEIAKEFLSE